MAIASNSIPYLTRKGQIRYTTAWGNRPALAAIPYNSPSSGPVILMGLAEQCIPVWWFSINKRDYQSLATGVGFNLNSLGSLPLMSRDLMLSYIIRIKKRVMLPC